MDHLILCPGSRSGPLAMAAGAVAETTNLKIHTAIDERSAAFMGVGISTGLGKSVIVITTSGTAVSNLLPAAVEADRSCQPIIFITADRPERLKNCGSNQTVNQEEFLSAACRTVFLGPKQGIHGLNQIKLTSLVEEVWHSANSYPGPVHLNLPIEEPLHPSILDQKAVLNGWVPSLYNTSQVLKDTTFEKSIITEEALTNTNVHFFSQGIVIAGPWRGKAGNLCSFNKSLKRFLSITGWPVFADPLSGIEPDMPGLIRFWELIISLDYFSKKKNLQVLRLGPIPSSRVLQDWLKDDCLNQVLITEDEIRPIDPLKIAKQYSFGFTRWFKSQSTLKNNNQNFTNPSYKGKLLSELIEIDKKINSYLLENLQYENVISEPSLAYWLPRILPESLPIMISASTPIRDWITFSGSTYLGRRCFGFRGASGIDGTLSLAIGLSKSIGRLILICGDLALLHDTNGWLLTDRNSPPLIVLLIDNAGGGIFKQLGIDGLLKGDFDKLFLMPQFANAKTIASAYQIPTKEVKSINEIKLAFDWGMTFSGPVLIRVKTDSSEDLHLRRKVSNEVKQYFSTY